MTAYLADGSAVHLGERIIDISAIRPADKSRVAERVYIETKNADPVKNGIRNYELELLRSGASFEDTERSCGHDSREDHSKVFRELITDMWLSRIAGRTILWKVNAPPAAEITDFARRHGLPFELELYH